MALSIWLLMYTVRDLTAVLLNGIMLLTYTDWCFFHIQTKLELLLLFVSRRTNRTHRHSAKVITLQGQGHW